MGARHRYQKVISNPTLGETKVITGNDRREVETKVNQQFAKWRERETKQQEEYKILNLQAQAELRTKEAQKRLSLLRELLLSGLKSRRKFDWKLEKDLRLYDPSTFKEVVPTYEQVVETLNVPPKRPLAEIFSPQLARERENMEAMAQTQLNTLIEQYKLRQKQAFEAYEVGKAKYNASIDDKRKRFEQGDTEQTCWVIKRVLDNLRFPEGYGSDTEFVFDLASGTVVVSMQLPNLIEIPKISNYKFVKTRMTTDIIELKPKEIETLYDAIIYQMVLLTMHRIFCDVYVSSLQSVVFNGWVTGVDPSNGNEFTSCVLSVQAERNAFQSINLERVDPKVCIRSLKGLVAGPLAQFAPVRPIMELDTFDKRFVESRDVLASLNSTDNLAVMDWEDFEHLVRELFSKIFVGYGSDVRVTQASRDGGVDAIAFDPDPIRGGKFVIQAKRYNKVVPVSAVRDLYGTMISEGAVKGILVTTSHYGNDSREFVKDKPITLIDGQNLIYMFQQHGYNVKIELRA